MQTIALFLKGVLFAAAIAAIVYFLVVCQPPQQTTVVVKKQSITSFDKKQITCLANNIYHEARGEPIDGQYAVAMVTMNRVTYDFGVNVCDVVYAGYKSASGKYVKNKCQFSWVCDGRNDQVRINSAQYKNALVVAYRTYFREYYRLHDITKGATFYHNTTVTPKWSHTMDKTVQIANHLFYRPDYER